jgi:DNA repair exonuclease SbcCD nuclease subunit
MSAHSFCFVHAADLHLDRPMRGLRRASPAMTAALGRAPLAAWEALVQLTIDQKAAFLLVAGDVCGAGERAIPAQLRFLQGLQRLSTHGIRTFIALGEDDPEERWDAIHEWPGGVHCFGSRDVESVTITTPGGQAVTIHGISHAGGRAQEAVARFRRGPESGIHIGLLHASVRQGDGTAGDSCPISALRPAGLDYWALGHDHRFQQVSEGRPWVVYPGTLQGRSLAAEEIESKGAVVATVANGVVSSVRHHALDAVRLMRTQVDVSMLASASDLRGALAATAARLRSDCPSRPLVAACDVVGRADAWLGAQPADAFWERLREEQDEKHAAGDADVWWDSLRDLTDAPEVASTAEISAYIHQLVETLRHAPGAVDRMLADHPAPLALVGQSTLDPIDVGELLGRAERVALRIPEHDEP